MKALPILLGGDLNCYSMALAFHEAGISPSVALGRYRLGVTSYSKVVKSFVDGRMCYEEGRIRAILDLADRYPERQPILIGCTDEYASFLSRQKGAFPPSFFIPSPEADLLRYADKECFWSACRSEGLSVPQTIFLHEGETPPRDLPFGYPVVVKPAVSEDYWHHPFPGMRKVWFLKRYSEVCECYERIRASGYRGTVLLQERIPSEDADNYVLTLYSDRSGMVRGSAFGRVLLEEHTPRGMGNHAAILTERQPSEAKRLIAFVEKIGYCGFSNFDFLRNSETGEIYVLEMNLRQGRSNHYMTAAGLNPAGLILADWRGEESPPYMETIPDVFWYSVPLSVVYSRMKDRALAERLRRLEKAGRTVSPFYGKYELAGNPLRRLFVREHERRVKKRARALAFE